VIKAYLNYPHGLITVHGDVNCVTIQANKKPRQRFVQVNITTIATELQNFYHHKHLFGSSAERNDMWLEIDFQDQAFEEAVLEYIRHQLGRYYIPFRDTVSTTHC